MRFFLYFCALAAGALLPMQAGINAQLKQHLGTPVQAVCISVVVSAIALWLYLLIARVPFPTLGALASVPPWALVGGGLCGAAYLPITLVLAQRLGAVGLPRLRARPLAREERTGAQAFAGAGSFHRPGAG